MTRVFGKLFTDERDGSLVVKPTKAFFGVSKHEKIFPVNQGSIDFELLPTPPGIHYLVGFKDPGDFTITDFTLQWRIPAVEEIDISPKKSVQPPAGESVSNTSQQVHVKRLATELSEALKEVSDLKHQLNQTQRSLADVTSRFDSYKSATSNSLSSRDATISKLSEAVKPETRTVYKEVAVPAAPLKQRIIFLEGELERLNNLNREYYESVVELHQLKLDRAQSLPSPGEINTPEDSPRQRLINKLFSR